MNVQPHHGGPQRAKPKAEVVAYILVSIKDAKGVRRLKMVWTRFISTFQWRQRIGNLMPMNFFTSCDGKQYGPYPMESLAEMIRKSQVVPTDLIFVEGWSNWRTVEDYLKSPSPRAASVAVPPLIPQLPPLLPVNERLVTPTTSGVGAAFPATLQGAGELEQSVLQGGRFVVFQYCFSVLIMSFKRSSSITFLRGDEDGFGPAFSNSLISLTVGWWGIPWGPIWTIWTVFKNACGGVDVTKEVLTEKLGAIRAAQIMDQRCAPRPSGHAMKLFRLGLIASPVLLFLAIMLLPFLSARDNSSTDARPRGVESVEFTAANRQINVHHDIVAFGNSPEAQKLAATFSNQMKLKRQAMFEGGKEHGVSLSGHEFLTHCELHGLKCAFIVHVPELRRFSEEAKNSLGTLAWITAQNALQKQGITNAEMQLAVGLRGVVLYDRVLLGNLKSDAQAANDGLTETVVGGSPENRLYPFFHNVADDISANSVMKVTTNTSSP